MLDAKMFAKRYLIIRANWHPQKYGVKFHDSSFSSFLIRTAFDMAQLLKHADPNNILKLEKRFPGINDVAMFGSTMVPSALDHIPIALYMVGYDLEEMKEMDWLEWQ